MRIDDIRRDLRTFIYETNKGKPVQIYYNFTTTILQHLPVSPVI